MATKNLASRVWVKAKVISDFFNVSLTAVYSGECGLSRIRSAYLPDSGDGGRSGKRRTARRFYWPDAEALHKEMLSEAERKEDIPEGILRLMGGSWKRRR